jgi:hypothetical protein
MLLKLVSSQPDPEGQGLDLLLGDPGRGGEVDVLAQLVGLGSLLCVAGPVI